MKHIYFLSGLGADRRVFQHLKLEGYSIHHIDWITPQPKETIESYALRLTAQITTPNPVLVGLSFGGMLAIEIGKQIDTEKIILISSAKSRFAIPELNRLGKIGFHHYVPASQLKAANFLMYWFFGVSTKHDKAILKNILNDSDTIFVKWAIDKVLNWSNEAELANVFSIHGNRDRLIRYTKADIVIKDGGHLMVMNMHEQVNEALLRILDAGGSLK